LRHIDLVFKQSALQIFHIVEQYGRDILYIEENSLLNLHIIFEKNKLKHEVFTEEKLDETGARHEHSSHKSFRFMLQET
jgi:hypothetical protein